MKLTNKELFFVKELCNIKDVTNIYIQINTTHLSIKMHIGTGRVFSSYTKRDLIEKLSIRFLFWTIKRKGYNKLLKVKDSMELIRALEETTITGENPAVVYNHIMFY